jgi:hypothetical protein
VVFRSCFNIISFFIPSKSCALITAGSTVIISHLDSFKLSSLSL